MTKKRGLLADIERAMNGLAQAHLGDYLTEREKKAALGAAEPVRLSISLPQGDPAAAPRRVALAVQGRIEPRALTYARNVCERMDADLDLVADLAADQAADREGSPLETAVAPQARDLARCGRRLEVLRLGRDLLTGLVDYARERRGLLFVVVSAEDAMAERVMARSTQDRHLDVPLVVVAGAESN
jgi:hypothetical protein